VKIVKVNLGKNCYEIKIGPGMLKRAGEELFKLGFRGQAVIISNPSIYSLWGEKASVSLKSAGFTVSAIEVPDGEEYKSLEQAGKLYEKMSQLQAERRTPVLALGGGVIGDLAGFVAATYMRGVPFIQLPTSLLAQVDSSAGGKVAVNHGKLKNIIGSFYQPGLVLADTETMKTLPSHEFINGMAEVIKYGVILDRDLFQKLEKGTTQLKTLDETLLEEIVSRSIGLKAGIVEKDERDTGMRNILNYGHTVGHAIETVSDLKIKHGNAVAVGMVAAGRISEKMGLLPHQETVRIESLILNTGLPVNIPGLEVSKILDAMEHDKKKYNGKVRFILLKTIGDALISDDVNMDLVEQTLRELL
jgi:3-dehydroquinate synthase